MSEPTHSPPEPRGGRLQILLAIIGGVFALGVAALGSGILDSGDSRGGSTGVSRAQNSGTCINSGSVGGDMTCQSGSSAPAGAATLKTTFERTDPGVFSLAFHSDPGLPRESDGWAELSARGGVDDGHGEIGFSLVNRADESMSVRDIALEVVRVDSTPTAAIASVYTQGDRRLGKFMARLDGPVEVGQRVPLVPVVDGQTPERGAPPYFRDNYISLKPGEDYQGQIALSAAPEPAVGLVEFRFVIEAFGPQGRFTVRDENYFKFTNTGSITPMHRYVAGYVAWLRSMPPPHGCPEMRARKWLEMPKEATTGCP